MKTLIVYGTKYGCTEKQAKSLVENLKGEVELYNLKKVKDINLSRYDKVVIGGSIYMGKIQKEVRGFCLNYLDQLKNKKVGLFICCMGEGEIGKTQLKDCFPEELSNKAIVKENFGGEFIFENMNFIDKLIAKKVSKVDKDTSNILKDNIERFIKLMNEE